MLFEEVDIIWLEIENAVDLLADIAEEKPLIDELCQVLQYGITFIFDPVKVAAVPAKDTLEYFRFSLGCIVL